LESVPYQIQCAAYLISQPRIAKTMALRSRAAIDPRWAGKEPGGVGPARRSDAGEVTQIMNLPLLAPDIQETLLFLDDIANAVGTVTEPPTAFSRNELAVAD
jgi:hypothetical protein